MEEGLHINTGVCKGCQYCVVACPAKALSMSEKTNAAAYHFVELDVNKCTLCGICYTVCPDYVFTLNKIVRKGEACG